VKKEQKGRKSLRRLKPTMGCNASRSRSRSSRRRGGRRRIRTRTRRTRSSDGLF
jgi:hypothetical protein